MDPLRPGDPSRIGKYALEGRLGQGGMGVVFYGHTPGRRPVAVKLIHAVFAADAEFRRRFRREVEAARKVGGFHTAHVLDADPDADPPWMVTAYVPGPSLGQELAERGPLPGPRLRALAAGLAEALDAIHAAGVIHRDLKPSNILLADDGPRVVDFGIARAADASGSTVQAGTPGFMSPELLTGEPLTPASDVFALGLVLAHAAGTLPFGDGPVQALNYRIVHQEPSLTGLDDWLADVVRSCLAKDPSHRPSPTRILGMFTDRTGTDAVPWAAQRARGFAARRATRRGLRDQDPGRAGFRAAAQADGEQARTATTTPPNAGVRDGDGAGTLAVELIILRASGLALVHDLTRDIKQSGGKRSTKIHPGDRAVAGDRARAGELASRLRDLVVAVPARDRPEDGWEEHDGDTVRSRTLADALKEARIWAAACAGDFSAMGEFLKNSLRRSQQLGLQRQSKSFYLDLADRLAIRLAAIPVDASGTDLSNLDLSDLDMVADVVWTIDTVWPKGAAAKVQARSHQIRPGVFQMGAGRPRNPAGPGLLFR